MTHNTLNFNQAQAMTEKDWQARLTDTAFYVLRQKGTERPFTGVYTNHKACGVYVCAGCGVALFDSKNKFDSGCGWPSFDDVINKGVINEHFDTSHGMRRTEVTCHNCNGHLGHVFTDGPTDTTGLRYCINSVALDFQDA